jgi:hypothetical protein
VGISFVATLVDYAVLGPDLGSLIRILSRFCSDVGQGVLRLLADRRVWREFFYAPVVPGTLFPEILTPIRDIEFCTKAAGTP